MKNLLLAAAALAVVPCAAHAQDAAAPDATATTTTTSDSTTAKAPDGSRAFVLEPYVGVLGGYESFDRRGRGDDIPGSRRMNGALVSGVAGVNVGLGPVFVGVEGNGTKGFNDIDWEYGVKGRVGARAGESGLIYASAGYEWIDAKHGFHNRNDWVYGVGAEVGPKDVGLGGLTGNAGVRIRVQLDTYDFKSLRPMAGLIFHL